MYVMISCLLQELTKLFLSHEKRWQHKYIAVNFIRLRLINMVDLDQHLTEHLQQPNNPETRQVVEFAGSIVQRSATSFFHS